MVNMAVISIVTDVSKDRPNQIDLAKNVLWNSSTNKYQMPKLKQRSDFNCKLIVLFISHRRTEINMAKQSRQLSKGGNSSHTTVIHGGHDRQTPSQTM